MSGFEVQRRGPQATLTVHLHAPVEGIPAAMAEALPEAWHAAEALGLPPSGPPFARYFSMPPGDVEFEAGVPTSDRAGAGIGRAEPGELPGGEVAVGWHVGPYETLDQTYDALARWIGEQGRSPSGPMWEVYWTDPGAEPDPATWRTEVIVPLA